MQPTRIGGVEDEEGAVSGSALADPLIQAQLLAEALQTADVGFLVWDEDRRYIAANDAACELLGTTLVDLLGQPVGGHTVNQDVDELVDSAIRSKFVQGTAQVARFDGSGTVKVFYATFTTRSAGMPFMATVIARLPK
jgi:PAS domain S-box-containing protein